MVPSPSPSPSPSLPSSSSSSSAPAPPPWATRPGPSPLRSQTSSGAAASAPLHIHHLQDVAAWASSVVPPLAAFLGTRLASSCQSLGCAPPPSPHTVCERCESILLVGSNCSVRVKPRKTASSSRRRARQPLNSIVYSCHYCSFENRKPGSQKAYVKEKLCELIAGKNKLTEEIQVVNVPNPAALSQGKKVGGIEAFPSSPITPGSIGKKLKRKGWLSLKDLAAASNNSPSLANKKSVSIENLRKSPSAFQKNSTDKRSKSMVSPSSFSHPLLVEDKLAEKNSMPGSVLAINRTVGDVDMKPMEDHPGRESEKLQLSTIPKTQADLNYERLHEFSISQNNGNKVPKSRSPSPGRTDDHEKDMEIERAGQSSSDLLLAEIQNKENEESHVLCKDLICIPTGLEVTTSTRTVDDDGATTKHAVSSDIDGEKLLIQSEEVLNPGNMQSDKEKLLLAEVTTGPDPIVRENEYRVKDDLSPRQDGDEEIAEIDTPGLIVDDSVDVKAIMDVETTVSQTTDSMPACQDERPKIIEESISKITDPIATVGIRGVEHVSADRALAETEIRDTNELPSSIKSSEAEVTHVDSNVLEHSRQDNESKDNGPSGMHNEVIINSHLYSSVLDPMTEASQFHIKSPGRVEHAVHPTVRGPQVSVEYPITIYEENMNTHPLKRTLSAIPIPAEISAREGVNDTSNAVDMQTSVQDNVNKDFETQGLVCSKPSRVSSQENARSFTESKLFAALQDKSLQKLEDTLDKVNNTLAARKQDAELLVDLQKSVRKQNIGRLKLENLFSSKHSNIEDKLSVLDAKYHSIEQKLSEIPNLQNEIHHLSDQVLKVTNAVNELREGLKEGLIEASAAKSDQILELAKAFNWLTDKLAYQSPPKLGGSLTEESLPSMKDGHNGSAYDVKQLHTNDVDVLQIEAARNVISRKRNAANMNVTRPSKRQKRHNKESVETNPPPTDKDSEKNSENRVSMAPSGSSNKKKPFLTKIGRHWFCLSKTNGKLHCRMI